jgi:hypothetical protein
MDQAHKAIEWLVNLAADQLPRAYDGENDWGDTKKVWAGVSVHRDGWELKTHRRFKELRHGRWFKYHLELPTSINTLSEQIKVQQVTPLQDGSWLVALEVASPLTFDCRIERWNLGIQSYSVNVTGNMRVRMKCTARISTYADYREIPPAMVVAPKIEAASLSLDHFEVERISKIGGDVAEELGDIVERVIRNHWLDKENDRLASRLNKSIEKKQDRLRFSMADWLTKRFQTNEAIPQ